MIHYHGLPITPETAAVKALEAGHAFVSFATPMQLRVAAEVCQSFAVDNGAFSAWKQGRPIQDWTPFYEWAAACKLIPSCDFAVVPDVIDGDEIANDLLLAEWTGLEPATPGVTGRSMRPVFTPFSAAFHIPKMAQAGTIPRGLRG